MAETYNLIIHLPLLLKDKKFSRKSWVWKMFLEMLIITRDVTAEETSEDQLFILDDSIKNYFIARKKSISTC